MCFGCYLDVFVVLLQMERLDDEHAEHIQNLFKIACMNLFTGHKIYYMVNSLNPSRQVIEIKLNTELKA